jgi:hypothetical protein
MFCCHNPNDTISLPVDKVISSCQAAMLDIAIHKESVRINLISKKMKRVNFWRKLFRIKQLTFDDVSKYISASKGICQVCVKHNDRCSQLIGRAHLAEQFGQTSMKISWEDFHDLASWYY